MMTLSNYHIVVQDKTKMCNDYQTVRYADIYE